MVLCQTVETFQAAVLIELSVGEQRQEEWETARWEDARDNDVNCTKCNQSLQEGELSFITVLF